MKSEKKHGRSSVMRFRPDSGSMTEKQLNPDLSAALSGAFRRSLHEKRIF